MKCYKISYEWPLRKFFLTREIGLNNVEKALHVASKDRAQAMILSFTALLP